MSRMTTRNGEVCITESSAGATLEKPKKVLVVVDVSASSAVKRMVDLFTEVDKDALQPAGSKQSVQEVAQDLLTASAGVKSQLQDGGSTVAAISGAIGATLQSEKDVVVNKSSKPNDDEEDDGYLSDDPEERYDAHAKSEVSQRIRFAIKDLHMEIQTTTKFQELSALFLNKKQYSRLQVTFERDRDANFVWKHGIVHTCVDRKHINLDRQHPVDPAYVKAHAADPLLVEVLFKGVDAVITPEMLCDMLVKAASRGSFLGLDFKEFAAGLPRGERLVIARDLNMIEDPILDKSNRQGVTGDNAKMKQMLADFQVTDAFKELRPDEREFTFFCRSALVSSRINEILVSQALVHQVAKVSHQPLPQEITDHKCGLSGEAPTSYLSALVKSRKAKVGIKELVKDGVSHTDAKTVLEVASQHFRSVFDDSSGAAGDAPELQWTPRRVLEEASATSLELDWTGEEVRTTIRELESDKSPGRDDLPKEVFQRHWGVLKGPVMRMVKEFVSTGKLPAAANAAVTTLLY
ncbi:unnamed protein product [Closterium sp. Yama58-4]|nr:unnamed protein product [Closterium sp. Yama58-4]